MLKVTPLDVQGDLPAIITNSGQLYEGNLIHYFQAVYFGSSNLELPYHNFRHMTHVLWLCYNAARFYEGDLSKRQIRNLLIAALFHDFDHTGRKGDDGENIARALEALERYILPEDQMRLDDIAHLIKGTQFPYVMGAECLGLDGRILRDADLMQAFSVAWFQQVVLGLAREWGQPPMEVLAMQEKFLGGIEFHTDWAKQLVPPAAVAIKVSEARALHDILKLPARTETLRRMQSV